jgi:hypothetical protein
MHVHGEFSLHNVTPTRWTKKNDKKFRVLQWTTMEDAMMNGMEWKGKGNELGT